MIKALFFDIDGTLVSFNTHRIPDSAVEELQRAHDKGIKIFISTGRPWAIINNLGQLQERHLIDGFVTINGSYCFVGNTIVNSAPLERSQVVKVAEYCNERKIPCIFCTADGIRLFRFSQLVDDLFYKQLGCDSLPEVYSIEQAVEGNVYQITPFINKEQEEEVLKSVTRVISNRWHSSFTDLTVEGAEKSKGVAAMAKHFGIKQSEVACFGDGGNDIPMLRWAGIGVAMGNAGQEVKDSADLITADIDDDGIAKAIRQINL